MKGASESSIQTRSAAPVNYTGFIRSFSKLRASAAAYDFRAAGACSSKRAAGDLERFGGSKRECLSI